LEAAKFHSDQGANNRRYAAGAVEPFPDSLSISSSLSTGRLPIYLYFLARAVKVKS